jgi:hypothetical protein
MDATTVDDDTNDTTMAAVGGGETSLDMMTTATHVLSSAGAVAAPQPHQQGQQQRERDALLAQVAKLRRLAEQRRGVIAAREQAVQRLRQRLSSLSTTKRRLEAANVTATQERDAARAEAAEAVAAAERERAAAAESAAALSALRAEHTQQACQLATAVETEARLRRRMADMETRSSHLKTQLRAQRLDVEALNAQVRDLQEQQQRASASSTMVNHGPTGQYHPHAQHMQQHHHAQQRAACAAGVPPRPPRGPPSTATDMAPPGAAAAGVVPMALDALMGVAVSPHVEE